MSKTSQCMELLKILYAKQKIVSIGELAREIETNPRNIPEYVRELREIGYDIKSIPGRYGGYLLEGEGVLPSIALTSTEKEGFLAGYEYLQARDDFLEKQLYVKAAEKILQAIKEESPNPSLPIDTSM